MTLEERIKEAARLKKLKDYDAALPHYEFIWKEQKTQWNGYFLTECYRQLRKFPEAYEILNIVKDTYPYFTAINNEKLWLDYSAKVKNRAFNDYISVAENIISCANQSDPFTRSVFIKTVLAVVKRTAPLNGEFKLFWLDKLDHSILDSKVFRFNNITYPADRKTYFLQYADALVSLGRQYDFLESKMASLGFNGIKLTQFMRYMVESYTFKTYDNSDYLSRSKIALYLKNLIEETQLKARTDIKGTYKKDKVISVSDLSHYLFCPVSMAINSSFEVYANQSWEKDEWKSEKLYLADRFYQFKAGETFSSVFNDTQIPQTEEMIKQFMSIFSCEMNINNVTAKEQTIVHGENEVMTGAPDYIFKHPNGQAFVLIEKFSHINASDHQAPFDSDLIKPVAFLEFFPVLNLDFGLVLNWFWHLENIDTYDETVKKKIVIKSYRISRIEKNELYRKKLNMTYSAIKKLRESATIDIDADRIAYANKCMNCSVVSYCHHKTGAHTKLNLPYLLNS